MKLVPEMRTISGRDPAGRVRVKEEAFSHGVSAVYTKALSGEPLDPDFGIKVDIEPEGEIEMCMAVFRLTEYWCAPCFAKAFSEVPDETQGLIYKKKDGIYGVILPVVGEQYKCVLKGTDTGLCARVFSWYDRLLSCEELIFVYAEGENPFQLSELCFSRAVKLLGNRCRLRRERVYPEIFEYLGWCTWDAMQIRVCEEGVLDKCREFQEKEIPVKWVILDDMWAHVKDFEGEAYDSFRQMVDLMHRSSLYSHEADPVRFPEGLSHTIDRIKEFHMAVGIWHPTTGYWRGIEKGSPAWHTFQEYLTETEDGRYIHDYKPEKAYMFYKTFHDFLRSCGADFVKIDNQTMTRRFYRGLAPVGEAARGFHSGMEASVGEHFGSTMINCMGTGSEDMWNRSMSPIVRCSDDFLPENREWFTKHILQCTFNSLIQGQLYYCDYDMWWTDDEQAVKNSVLRAVSGGPIYVSDQLGRSRREILEPLILSDGRILRCDRPGMPSGDCLFSDPAVSGRIFKVQNQTGDSGVIAVFNLNRDGGRVNGTVSPSDVEGLAEGIYAVYEHFSGACRILGYRESMEVVLENIDEYRLYILAPVKDGFGVIGRTDKFISPAAVEAVAGRQILLKEEGPCAWVEDGELKRRNWNQSRNLWNPKQS